MDVETFQKVFTQQIENIEQTLGMKAKEYATDDRLHNFKKAAALKGETLRKALAGMMAKHTVSIYDMCASGKQYPIELWDEKITDHLNYLILLKAIVVEESLDSESERQT